jgi:hypothetical protein
VGFVGERDSLVLLPVPKPAVVDGDREHELGLPARGRDGGHAGVLVEGGRDDAQVS